jgi:hypothetical protein
MIIYRCILLLEDLDAAFTRSVTRDSTSTGTPTVTKEKDATESDGSTLSLSGLLNALDGVAGGFFFPFRTYRTILQVYLHVIMT